ncbi:radical SAM protein [Paenibacillus durus]|uniref:radical SAM protein n=1 Tax=Paenibacillus durus TaxID=44251 RepID=UPI0006946A33|nr:radical SAM protein [Paenibacillus durus]
MKLNLFTTNACNLNCTYCYEKNKNSLQMSEETGIKAIDHFWNKDKDGIFNINFHGGEPLLKFDLIKKIVGHVNDKCQNDPPKFTVDFSLTTNGTLISKEIGEFFKQNNFNVRLSLDGKLEAHDLHRRTYGNKGTFNKVLSGAFLLKEAKVDFTTRMTVTPENVYYLVESVEWLLNNDFLKINIVTDTFSNWNEKFEFLRQAFWKIKELYIDARNNKQVRINLFDGKFSSYILDSPPLFCNAGFGSFSISTSGLIYPCVYVVDLEEFCIGDVNTGISSLRRKECIESCLKREDSCGDCNIQGFCQARKCGFLNYLSNGYLDQPNPFLCKREQLLYSLTTEVFDRLYHRNDSQINWMIKRLKSFPHLTVNKDIKQYLS